MFDFQLFSRKLAAKYTQWQSVSEKCHLGLQDKAKNNIYYQLVEEIHALSKHYLIDAIHTITED
jgi:hypothetical protein